VTIIIAVGYNKETPKTWKAASDALMPESEKPYDRNNLRLGFVQIAQSIGEKPYAIQHHGLIMSPLYNQKTHDGSVFLMVFLNNI